MGLYSERVEKEQWSESDRNATVGHAHRPNLDTLPQKGTVSDTAALDSRWLFVSMLGIIGNECSDCIVCLAVILHMLLLCGILKVSTDLLE